MKLRKAREAIQIIAKSEGKSVNQIRKDVKISIADAMKRAKKENNTEVLEMWSSIPRKGDIPTPEEFIAYMSEQTNKIYYTKTKEPSEGSKQLIFPNAQ